VSFANVFVRYIFFVSENKNRWWRKKEREEADRAQKCTDRMHVATNGRVKMGG